MFVLFGHPKMTQTCGLGLHPWLTHEALSVPFLCAVIRVAIKDGQAPREKPILALQAAVR